MKNQLDLIISVVALILAFIFAGIFYGTKRTITKPPEPTKVNTAALALPTGDVKFANSLPGSSGSGSRGSSPMMGSG